MKKYSSDVTTLMSLAGKIELSRSRRRNELENPMEAHKPEKDEQI